MESNTIYTVYPWWRPPATYIANKDKEAIADHYRVYREARLNPGGYKGIKNNKRGNKGIKGIKGII